MNDNILPIRADLPPGHRNDANSIPRVDLYEQLSERPVARRGLLDRCAGWFGTERGFGFALGFYSGCMFTIAVALVLVFVA